MKKITTLLLCFFALTVFAQKQIHTIFILDTDIISRNGSTSELRNGAITIRDNINAEVIFLKRYMNIPEQDVHFYEVSGKNDGKNNFTVEGLSTVLSEFNRNCKEDDVVIIATYSHGVKAIQDSIDSPSLILGQIGASEYIAYAEILRGVLESKPAFVLSFVSACQTPQNEIVTRDLPSFPVSGTGTGSGISDRNNCDKQYKKLFKNPDYEQYKTVSVELYSCEKNEVSYLDSRGGFFAFSFFQVLEEKMDRGENADISWMSIIEQVKTDVRERTASASSGPQTPLGVIEFFGEGGELVKKEYISNRNAPIVKAPIVALNKTKEHLEYSKLKKKPGYKLACRFVKLANSYLLAGYPEVSLEALKIAIPVIQQRVDENDKAKRYPSEGHINKSGEAIYALGWAYEVKAHSLKTANLSPNEVKTSFEMAKNHYKRLKAKSSQELMNILLKNMETVEDLRP